MKTLLTFIVLIIGMAMGASANATPPQLVLYLPIEDTDTTYEPQPTTADFVLNGNVQQVTSQQTYTTGMDMNFEETWQFNPQGLLTQYTKRGFGGQYTITYPQKTTDRHKIWRDDDGDPLEEITYTLDGNIRTSAHYIYDNKGRLSAVVTYYYAQDGEHVVNQYEEAYYNTKGQLTTKILYSVDAVMQMREVLQYNRQGHVVRRTQQFYSGSTTTQTVEQRKYRYDAHKNWIQCQYFHNGNHLYTITRTIQYR